MTNKKYALIALIIITLGTLGLAWQLNKPEPRTTYVHALLPNYKSKDLIKQSYGIIIGTVEKTEVTKAPSTVRPNEEDIVTNATIKVEKYLNNPKSLINQEIVVQTVGGNLGEITSVAEEAATFKQGERVVVFLNQQTETLFTVYGWALGKYTINADEKLGNEKELVYLHDVFGKDITLTELEQQINNIAK